MTTQARTLYDVASEDLAKINSRLINTRPSTPKQKEKLIKEAEFNIKLSEFYYSNSFEDAVKVIKRMNQSEIRMAESYLKQGYGSLTGVLALVPIYNNTSIFEDTERIINNATPAEFQKILKDMQKRIQKRNYYWNIGCKKYQIDHFCQSLAGV